MSKNFISKTIKLNLIILAFFFSFTASSSAQNGWTWQNPLPQGNSIGAVYLLNANTGWVVGANGLIMKTTNGGNNWTIQTSGTKLGLSAVVFFDANTGIIVGSSGGVGIWGTILKTTDGGNTWISRPPATLSGNLTAISFINPNTGWAVGSSGTIIKTINGGDTWARLQLGSSIYTAVHFSDSLTGSVLSGGAISRTTDGGVSWFPQSTGAVQSMSGVYYIDNNTGWVAGQHSYIFKTTNSGNNWVRQPVTDSQWLYDISFFDINTGYAVGARGTIFKTTNSGTNWVAQSSGLELILGALSIGDANNVMAVSVNSAIIKTSNSGANWVEKTNGTYFGLNDVCFLNSTTGYAIGAGFFFGGAPPGGIVKTTNGGVNWIWQSSPRVADISSVTFVDVNTGFIIGDTLFRTTNGGQNWNYLPRGEIQEPLYGISFLNANTGYAAGTGGVIIKTTNSGFNWTLQPSGTTELLMDIFFANENTGWTVGYTGIILKTTNGGDTWTQQASNLTDVLWDLEFVDANTGYTCGTSGDVFKTTDAGNTWILKNTNTENSFSGLSFVNANTGVAVGDNGVIIRTINGGETWQIQQQSGTTQSLSAVWLESPNLGWAVGGNGTILKYSGMVPAAPQNLELEIPALKKVKLSWIDLSQDEDGFAVQRRTLGDTNWANIDTVASNTSQCIDSTVVLQEEYFWRVYAFNSLGNSPYSNEVTAFITSAISGNSELPKTYALHQNYPNPFNPVTQINFDIPAAGKVNLKIFDISGREVATLVNAIHPAGYYTVTFDAQNLASGIYFYRINVEGTNRFSMTKKMMIIK